MRQIDRRLIIAEIGSVHDGSFGNALKLVELAKDCGANAVKFQTHIAEFETTIDAPNPGYFSSEGRYEYFERTGFTIEQWEKIKHKCSECGLFFISSPFSIEAADLLQKVGVDYIKVASGEVSNIPMLRRIAEYNMPVLLSSGMSDWQELDAAVSALSGNHPLCVMQCSSSYPCAPEDVGLNVIEELKSRYSCSVGYSDHTKGLGASVAAAAIGASVIEKHLTFSNDMYGSDAKNAMEPAEFKLMTEAIWDVWRMTDNPVNKQNNNPYQDMKYIFEKSIVAKFNLSKGTVLELSHLAYKKPSGGIKPKDYETLIGKKLTCDVDKDAKISWDNIE